MTPKHRLMDSGVTVLLVLASHGLCYTMVTHHELVPGDAVAAGEILHGVAHLVLRRRVDLTPHHSHCVIDTRIQWQDGRGCGVTDEELLIINGITSSRLITPVPPLSYFMNSAVSASDTLARNGAHAGQAVQFGDVHLLRQSADVHTSLAAGRSIARY